MNVSRAKEVENAKKVRKLQIEKISIEEIKEYKNNAKLHPREQIKQIKKSIEEFGNNDPIAIDENNVIIEGHGRYTALKELGYKEVEVIRLEHLDEEQKKAYMLVHNKLTMNSDFDIQLLTEELENIIDIDMSEFGFEFDLPEEEKEIGEEKEEELFDDIEKLEKYYGVPYQGNKSRIADIIINVLPRGKRLVDLFGRRRCNNALCLIVEQMGKAIVQRH